MTRQLLTALAFLSAASVAAPRPASAQTFKVEKFDIKGDGAQATPKEAKAETKKEEVAEDLLKRRPELIMERAVKGMLPKNRLGRKMIKKFFVYAGGTHQHSAQQPKELKF